MPNEATEMNLELRTPIKLADRTIESIDLREPTASQIVQVEKRTAGGATATASNILLVALCSGITEPEIARMAISDLSKALEFLGPFIHGAPKTGSGS